MEDTEALPNYPYRDDALLIFEVIYDYVREVLEAFYGKLRNWVLNLFPKRTEICKFTHLINLLVNVQYTPFGALHNFFVFCITRNNSVSCKIVSYDSLVRLEC